MVYVIGRALTIPRVKKCDLHAIVCILFIKNIIIINIYFVTSKSVQS